MRIDRYLSNWWDYLSSDIVRQLAFILFLIFDPSLLIHSLSSELLTTIIIIMWYRHLPIYYPYYGYFVMKVKGIYPYPTYTWTSHHIKQLTNK
ncbi:hypothetical protein BDQ94DRAFT_135330 [Aspergillus welwitschiae]|uniref:Uncharacterized protein n=1 Tax=Aspergillus welwitschiae TaxID=1341132 RepID=A0A3F3QF69_9EURO|nr:hypothetical protein BDQ94DRAFT_135330 [Aspergillus welwitschiae]RDH37934.1 hypothetical protein BDQ94DRAFT_135330 [Aspergillus welwitschiae]